MSDKGDLQPSFPFKPLTSVVHRLVNRSVAIEHEKPEDITYQHTVLCQTCLPFRLALFEVFRSQYFESLLLGAWSPHIERGNP